MNGYVYALAVFDDGSGPDLYAGGSFTTAGGVPASGIARWDGAAWSALGDFDGVQSLAVFDDGSGPGLHAGGSFYATGLGLRVNNIARWNGSAWSALSGPNGTGTNYSVHALAVFDDSSGPALYAGGSFTTAGGLPSSRIAAWRCRSDSIFADGFEQGNTAAWSHTKP